MARLIGVDCADITMGLKVKAKFRRKATWPVPDAYFIRDAV
jgi:hypothetical protein